MQQLEHFSLPAELMQDNGHFYPTNYIMCIVPTYDNANNIKKELEKINYEYVIDLLSPALIIKQIGNTEKSFDKPFSTQGSANSRLRRYISLAKVGHWAVLVNAPNPEDVKVVMDIIKSGPFIYSQKYHSDKIEDLE